MDKLQLKVLLDTLDVSYVSAVVDDKGVDINISATHDDLMEMILGLSKSDAWQYMFSVVLLRIMDDKVEMDKFVRVIERLADAYLSPEEKYNICMS